MLLSSCGVLTNMGFNVGTSSSTITSENRDVSGFNAIDFSTFGKINVSQGDKESLNISGPADLVQKISTTVTDGTLIIDEKGNITLPSISNYNTLTYTIVVKDLSSLNISGAGDVQVETLTSPDMNVTLTGAGKVQMNQLTTDRLIVEISGLGGLEISGSASQATIDISGTGNLNAPDLKIQTAVITIPGLGSATVWVTDKLIGTISGAGSISYFGSPQTITNSTGIGSFKPLGNK